MTNSNLPTPNQDFPLSVILEALLFVAPAGVSLGQLSQATEKTKGQISKALSDLEAQYQERGLRLQLHNGRYQLTTAPEFANIVETFLGLEATARFSNAALESLAIIAYQQPVTRPQIDAIRGVNSDGVIKNLLHKGLIEEIGRAESPGRPILYSTTPEFLGHFGLTSLENLPPLALEEITAKETKKSDENGLLKD